MSLRQDIIKMMNGDVNYESIYRVCKSKGYTNAKAEEVTKTITLSNVSVDIEYLG